MTELVEFGWNAIGFLFGAFVILFAASLAWCVLTTLLDTLADWVERNGWS